MPSISALTIQMPLEDRVIFQMDQTTPAYQGIFGNIRKRRQISNLDCDIHLRADRHYQERTKTQTEPLHNSTDFKRDHFQQNPYCKHLQKLILWMKTPKIITNWNCSSYNRTVVKIFQLRQNYLILQWLYRKIDIFFLLYLLFRYDQNQSKIKSGIAIIWSFSPALYFARSLYFSRAIGLPSFVIK